MKKVAELISLEATPYYHFHIALHVNQSKARNLTDLEVVQRWHKLYKGNLLTQKIERDDELSEAQMAILDDMVKIFRERLICISWYMRRLNKTVAILANDKNNCTGPEKRHSLKRQLY
jgi:hypothetical protein